MLNISLFKIPYNGHNLIGNMIKCKSKDMLLMLHGGGPNASMERFSSLRNELLNKNISTFSFDFVGHGLTGGDIKSTNLQDRTYQAINVIESVHKRPLSILATSMAAHTAIKITESHKIENIILTVPAVYNKKAYDVNFGPKFSDIIRQKRSWVNTDAWQILSEFKGQLIIISADQDKVIDREIPQRLYDSATEAKSRKIFHIQESSHMIFPYFNTHHYKLIWFVDVIKSLFEKTGENNA